MKNSTQIHQKYAKYIRPINFCHDTTFTFQMEEEEHTDRKQQLAMLYQKLNKIKKSLYEGSISIFQHDWKMGIPYLSLSVLLSIIYLICHSNLCCR